MVFIMLLFALQNFLELEFLMLSELPHLNHTAVVFQASFQAYYVSFRVTQDFFSGTHAMRLQIMYQLQHTFILYSISRSYLSFTWLPQKLVRQAPILQ